MRRGAKLRLERVAFHDVFRLGERGGNAFRIGATTLGQFRTSTTLAADERSESLNDFSGLDLLGVGGRDGTEESDFSVTDGNQDGHALPVRLEDIGQDREIGRGAVLDVIGDEGNVFDGACGCDEIRHRDSGILLESGLGALGFVLFVLGDFGGGFAEAGFAVFPMFPKFLGRFIAGEFAEQRKINLACAQRGVVFLLLGEMLADVLNESNAAGGLDAANSGGDGAFQKES